MDTEANQVATPLAPKPHRWRRRLRRLTVAIVVLLLLLTYLIWNDVRTLQSLRRIPGTNAYVMDYYGEYNMDEILVAGMDVNHIEESYLRAFFPDFVVPVANWLKGAFVPDCIETLPVDGHHCSTVALRTDRGDVIFGRNFDWMNDACLVLRIHDADSIASVSVIDLAYMNLDRNDLDTTNLIERIPLLFAPYYVEDGMNRHGVAVSDMAVDGARAPHDPARPDMMHATLMRLILDYAKTTEAAIALVKQYNIYFVAQTCHLMIADASGDSAAVEFIDGEVKITRSDENWQVCTNHQLWGTSEEDRDASCARYRLASEQLVTSHEGAECDDVMQIMRSVSAENRTMWSSVYNLSSGDFQFAHRRNYDDIYQDRITTAK
jgi:predicted choloylglycine hydrolase